MWKYRMLFFKYDNKLPEKSDRNDTIGIIWRGDFSGSVNYEVYVDMLRLLFLISCIQKGI